MCFPLESKKQTCHFPECKTKITKNEVKIIPATSHPQGKGLKAIRGIPDLPYDSFETRLLYETGYVYFIETGI